MTDLGLSEDAYAALMLSLKVSAWATTIMLPVALLTAYLLERGRFWGREALNVIVHLPLVLPPVVTGYALLIALGKNGALGGLLASFNMTVVFHWTGAVIAASVMAFPLMVRAIALSLAAVDPKLEEVALTLGLSPFQVFARITLPLITPGLTVGATLGFAKALGEFGATITFVGNIPQATQTLPSAIYTQLQIPGAEAEALQLILWATGLAVALVLLSEIVSRAVAKMVRGQ